MSNPSGTVVVCTLRHGDDLPATLAALRADLPPSTEILVIRSGTPAGSPLPGSLEGSFADGAIRAVCVEQEGVARARARGLREATTDVVVFLDDDARPRPGWYRALTAPFSDANMGAVGGTILPVWPDGRRPFWLSTRLTSYFGERHAGPNAGHRPFGANMAVRRSAAEDVGGLSLWLGHSGGAPGLHEETELCERLSEAGYGVGESPGAVVDHRVRREQVSVSWVLRRAWHHGRSDSIRDLQRGRPDASIRILKLVGLVALWPFALVYPRAMVYVTARVLVNVGYLRHRVNNLRGFKNP